MATPPPATTTTAAPEEVSAVEGAPAAALPVVSIASLYVGDLAESVDETVLLGVFSQVAPVASVRVCRDTITGVSLGYGYVNFHTRQDAVRALEALNFVPLNGKNIRLMGSKHAEEWTINDEKLKKLFEEFGEITSCKITLDSKGRSKGSGFVSFATTEAGHSAINAMNGKMVENKPLYVGLHQPKGQRRAMLTAHFAQRYLAMAAVPYAAPQQVYFGHPTPGQIPPQAAVVFGFPPHLVPGMGPGTPFVMPQNVQRIGARHGAMLPQMYRQQQQVVFMSYVHRFFMFVNPQLATAPASIYVWYLTHFLVLILLAFRAQMTIHPNANQRVRYMLNARNGAYPPKLPQGFASVMPSVQQDVSNLTSALASASPEEQQQMLGTKLYPLVEHLEPGQAAKVTGMLLEMDKVEILNLLESPEALRAKVREAMLVLQRSAPGGSADPAATVAAQQ
nr:unnamed protein product [Digitaria exilis]